MPRLPVVFGQAGDAELVEQRLHLVGRLPHIAKSTPGRGVEVDAQLVGVVGVVGLVRPHVEAEAAEVDRPQHVGQVGGHQRLRRWCRWASPRSSSAASRARLSGTRFWKNDEPPAPVGEALQQHRAAAHGRASAARRPPGSSGPGRAWSRPARRRAPCPGWLIRPLSMLSPLAGRSPPCPQHAWPPPAAGKAPGPGAPPPPRGVWAVTGHARACPLFPSPAGPPQYRHEPRTR